MRTFFDRCRVHLTVSALQRGFRELICVFVASMGDLRAALEARSNNGPMHLHERLLEEWRPVLLGLSSPMLSWRGEKPQCRAGRLQKSNHDLQHVTRASTPALIISRIIALYQSVLPKGGLYTCVLFCRAKLGTPWPRRSRGFTERDQ